MGHFSVCFIYRFPYRQVGQPYVATQFFISLRFEQQCVLYFKPATHLVTELVHKEELIKLFFTPHIAKSFLPQYTLHANLI